MISKENQFKQQSIKMQLFQCILQLYHFAEFNRMLSYILTIFGEFQYITFLWVPIFETTQIAIFGNQINYLTLLIYVSRADLIIQLQFLKSQYYFLLPLASEILFSILPLLLMIIAKHHQFILRLTVLRFYFQACSFYWQVFLLNLLIPYLSFCTHSIIFVLADNASLKYANFAFIIITLVFIGFKIVMITLLCRETISLKINRLQQLNQTFLDYIQITLQIVQIIVYGAITVETNGQILQSILVLVISLIKLLQIFQYQHTNKPIININLLILAFGIITSVFILVNDLQDKQFTNEMNIFMFILFLLLSKITIVIYNENENRICNNIVSIKQDQILKYYLAKLINRHMSKEEQKFIDVIIKGWILKHINTSQEGEQGPDYQQQLPESTSKDQFIIKKLRQYVKSVQKNKEYDLHYVSLLYQFGFTNLALQQINSQLNLSTNTTKSKGFLVDSENPSLGNEQSSGRKNINQSISSKSVKSNSNDVNDIANKNQQKKSKLFIYSKHQLSGVQGARAFYLKNEIKQEIQTKFYERNKTNQQLNEVQLGVELFLRNEKRNQNLKNSIISLITEKIAFTQQFTTKKTFQPEQLFKQAKLLSNLQLKLENKLYFRYQQFPSLKIQSILMFYQGEILNNYVEAYKYKALTSMPDEQLINMDANIKSTFFTKKVVFLNIILEDNQNLQIQRKSENALKFFQINPSEAKYFTNIDYILPEAIKNEHRLLISRFITTSKSKFYLNSSQTFFKLNHLLIKSCQFIFDIHFDSVNHYKFSAFFSESINQSAYILVDINHIVGGLTESFFEKIGYGEKIVDQIKKFEESQVQIESVIPNFRKLTESKIQSAITELRFLKEDFLLNQETEHRIIRQATLSSSNWSNLEQLYIYEAEIFIQYQEIFGYYYYIIEIKDIKQQFHQKKSIGNSIRSKKQEGIEEFFKLSELSENEAIANSPKVLVIQNTLKENEFQVNGEENILSSEQLERKQVQLQAQALQDYASFQEQHILSPNTSNAPWVDSSQLPFRMHCQQQQYYSKDKDLSISAYESKVSNKEEVEDEPQQISRNINVGIAKNSNVILQEEDKQSSSNTALKGIKKSQFYKKYEMVSSLVEQIFPNTLKLFIFFQEITYLIAVTYFLIVLVGVQTDLNRFIGEIDMIQLHAGIMNPHDLYLQMRQTIFTYQGFLSAGKLTQDQYQTLSDPLYLNIAIGYYEFKDGFIQWLSNDYLTPFFKDKNITVYYMLNDATKTYPLTQNIREALLATLSYYYQFKLKFESRQSPANQTYQIYQFANVYNFHTWLETLTLEVLVYSKSRSIDISEKWNTIWIIYLIIDVLPLIASIYYYRYFKSKFDKYINLFRYCTTYKMEKELEKLKSIMKMLNKNADLIFTYNFLIDIKEESIYKEKQISDHDLQKQKDVKMQQQFKNLNFMSGFVFQMLGWLVFLGLSILGNTFVLEYLQKYQATADLYKLLQDMTLYAGTMYRNRDFGLNFPNLPYLRDFDKQQFYVTIDTGLLIIDEFLELSYSFDQTKYQVSTNFLTFFYQIQQNDVCESLGDELLGFLTQYCSTSLQGSLRIGLSSTLKFIKTSITNQMAMNNFTKRIEYNTQENEGSLVVFRATQKLSYEFKYGMIKVTESQIQISNSISIVFLIYSFILMTYLYFWLLKDLKMEILLARRFVLLIPSGVLFSDDQFDRHVRLIVASQEY